MITIDKLSRLGEQHALEEWVRLTGGEANRSLIDEINSKDMSLSVAGGQLVIDGGSYEIPARYTRSKNPETIDFGLNHFFYEIIED